MTELFRYRVDETREMVLCDDGRWYCHQAGEEPKLWNLASPANMAMAAEIARLRAAVDRDKTGLAAGLNAVRNRLAGSAWLGEDDAWGSYEFDERTEANLRREFAECLAEAEEIAVDALRASGTLATATLRNEPLPGEVEIARLRAELDGAREEAFRYGFKRDCDPDDREAIQQADDLRSLVGWIAEAESTARRERDNAYGEVERLRAELDGWRRTSGVGVHPERSDCRPVERDMV